MWWAMGLEKKGQGRLWRKGSKESKSTPLLLLSLAQAEGLGKGPGDCVFSFSPWAAGV